MDRNVENAGQDTICAQDRGGASRLGLLSIWLTCQRPNSSAGCSYRCPHRPRTWNAWRARRRGLGAFVTPIKYPSHMQTGRSRNWVWRAYALLAVVVVALIAASATLRETIDAPWAQILAPVLQTAAIFLAGPGSLAIQKRRHLFRPLEE